MTKYSDAADQLFSQDPQPVDQPALPAGKSKYAAAADTVFDSQATELRRSALGATQANPDQAAKAGALARRTGLPPDVVERNLPEVEGKLYIEDLDKETADTPATRRAYGTPYVAKAAKDDVSTITKIERGLRDFFGGGQRIKPFDTKASYDNTAQRFDLMTDEDMKGMKYGAVKGWQGPAPTAANIVEGIVKSVPQRFEAVKQGMSMQMGDLLDSLGILKRDDVTLNNSMRKLQQSQGASAFTTPEFETTTGRAAYSGGVSLVNTAPGIAAGIATRNPNAALGYIFGTTQPDAYGKYRARGGTPTEAAVGGTAEAAIEVATELLPTKTITDMFGRANMGEFVTKFLGQEMWTEQVATLLQDAVDTAVANPDKTWGEYLAERPDAAYQTLVATLVQAGAMGAGHKAMSVIADQQAREYQDAQNQAALLQDLMATAAGSKLRERDANTFRDVVQAAAEEHGGAPKAVYVDGETMLQTLQQAGITDADLDQLLPSVRAQLADAAAANSPVEIPIGELLAAVPGSPLEQALSPHIRMTADGLSQVEAEQQQQLASEFLSQEADRLIQQSADSVKLTMESDAIRENIKTQLDTTSRFAPDVTAKYAKLVQEFYTVMASRVGTTPAELYERMPYKVDSKGKTTGVLHAEVDALSGIFGGSTIADVRQALTTYKKGAAAAPLAPAEAKVAEGMLTPMLERAAAAKPAFDATVNEIAATLKGKAKIPGLKGLERAGQKLIRETDDGTGKPDPSQIRDLLRATVVVPRVEDVAAAIKAIGEKFNVIRTKDRFAQPLPSGYRDVLMNVELADGSMAEVQISVPAMMAAKSVGHKLYEMSRAKRDGDVEKAALEALQERLYAEAFDFAQNAASDASALDALSAKASGGNGRDGLSANTADPSASLSTGTPSTSNTSAPSGTSNGNFISTSLDDSIVADGETLEQSVSTRVPTGKKNTENPLADQLVVDFATVKRNPTLVEKFATKFDAIVSLRTRKMKDPAKRLDAYIEQMTDNLLWLHDQVPADIRERSKLWYDGARAIVDRWAARYEGRYSDVQVSSVLAVMSPQMDWFTNVTLAERIVDVWDAQQDFAWTPAMTGAINKTAAAKDPETIAAITGKTLAEVDDTVLQAYWIAAYDLAYNPRAFHIVTPEGDFADLARNADGKPKRGSWANGFGPVAKAVSVLKDGSLPNVSKALGGQHKVRNFYNNIFAPDATDGSITVDTHAVAAGLMLPMSSSSVEVLDNFGAAGSDANTGISGSYPVYAEAYRRAAERRGLLAREMQSITWEAVRGLFSESFKGKYNSKKDDTFKRNFDTIWKDYHAEKITIEQARQRVIELAGGVTPPDWYGPGSAVADQRWSSSYAGELLAQSGVGGTTGRGAGGNPASGTVNLSPGVANETGYNQSATRDRGGRYADGGLAPLEGAPTVRGASGPDASLVDVAERYARSIGVDLKRQSQYVKVDPERAARIAAAYDAMPHAPNDPAVKEAFENLIRQTVAQYRALEEAGYKFWFIDPASDVYEGNPWNAMRDLRANQSMGVFPTEAGFGSGATELDTSNNPLMVDTGIEWAYGNADGPKKRVLANDLFRAVHDAFGHGLEGSGFRAEGEENAWQAHVRLFTGSAVGAITSETRGQNSWLNYGPYGEQNRTAKVEDTVFADQKTGLMPEWTWTEGRVEDMDDGTQAEQRRIRQVLDLAVLQADTGKLNQSAQPVPQTETEAFKAWFGDSKVVDAEGKPLVVYHGTNRSFDQFNPKKVGDRDPGFFGEGFYFTPNEDDARSYADSAADADGTPIEDATVIPAFVSLQNPFIWDMEAGDGASATRNALAAMGIQRSSVRGDSAALGNTTERRKFMAAMSAAGHDGVLVRDEDGFREVVAFNPTQIKSAIGNNGQFDTSNPNILMQGPATPGRVDITGIHFSKQTRVRLDGRFYGTGLKGIERERIFNGTDARLRERVMFYVDEGKGVRPEAGVGGAAHSVNLPNLYDINKDPLGLIVGGNLNQTESNILDAGFDGYYVRNAFNQQGAAVIIGNASRDLEATPIPNPTTKAPPLPVGPQTYKRGLTSAELMTLDIDKVKATAPTARVRSGTFMVDEADLKAASAAMAAQGIALPPQTYAQEPELPGPRGTFDPSTLTTVLNENADLSTFLHETGHFFLEAMAKLAVTDPGVNADMGKLLQWFGVADLDTWNGMTLNQKRPHHERFAESFEQYLLEGKAPNTELASLFRTFRAWLTRVYRSLKEFSAGRNLQLSDDIRQVMDRMVASEDQIAEAEKVAGLVPNLDATGEAIEKLQARSIRDLKWAVNARSKMIKKLQAEAAAKRKEVEAEIRKEVEAEPVYRADRLLRKGMMEESDMTNAQRKAMDSFAGMKLKLGLPQLREMYGEAPNAPWRYLATGKNGLAASEGVHPDVLADALGYESGDALVRALLSADPIDVEVEGRTDQRMLERYGDLVDQNSIEEAALEAVHNQARAKSLATELAAQREMLNPRKDTGKTNAKGQKVTTNAMVEAAKQFAAGVIGRRKLADLKKAAWGHLQAERRAAKTWEAATAKGDTAAAVQAKQDQMLNHYAYSAAKDAQEQVEKSVEFFRKVLKGSSEKLVERGIDPDVANAARAVLAMYGVGMRGAKGAMEYLALVEKNDPSMFNAIRGSVEGAVDSAKPLDQLTLDELTALTDEVKSLWHLARRSRQMEVDGDLLDRADVAARLKDRMDDIGIPDTMPGDTSAITPAESAMRLLSTFRASAQRVENWAESLDGKFGGPFTRFVFQPVKEAADRYRADKATYIEAYRKLLEKVGPSMKRQTIAAPELGYTFGKDTGGVAMSELLHALLHTGNASNKRKLLLGRNWATENADGSLDTSRWDSFLERMATEGVITKEHYDFVQGVWDLLEKTKPLAQKTHRDVFGRYFAEVTADSFDTPFGKYRGGYAPALADPRIVSDAATRALAEEENQTLAFAFPATNRGFTKGRVDYNRPLMLDLRTLAQHIDKVLLFSHMESPVRDVRKLLTHDGVPYGLNRIDPVAFDNLVTPWLNRAARQQVETPVAGAQGLMRIFTAARNRAGMAAMFANVANAAQQITGFSLAAVKVKPSLMVSAAAEMIAHPKKTYQRVADASVYMRERMENDVANAETAMRDILLDPNVYDKAKAWSSKHAYFLQQAVDNTLSPVIWTAAFNQAVEQGQSDKDAVRFADSVIRTTQGSTLPEDVSRFEGGNAFVRVFTQFAGYFNMQANLLGTEFSKLGSELGVRQGVGRGLYVTLMGFLAPAWVAEAIMQAFRGGPDDEDKDGEYLDDWLAAVLGWSTLRGLTAMIPGVGQVINATVNSANSKPYDDRIGSSPAISMIESSVRAPVSVYKAVADEGNQQKAVRDVATLISMTTGIPVSAAARPIGYLAGVGQGKIDPTGPVDAVRGMVNGVASPESK